MFKALFTRLFLKRTRAEKESSDQFLAQVKEAFLSQDSLKEAVDQLRKTREECESNRPTPMTPRNSTSLARRAFGSTPS